MFACHAGAEDYEEQGERQNALACYEQCLDAY